MKVEHRFDGRGGGDFDLVGLRCGIWCGGCSRLGYVGFILRLMFTLEIGVMGNRYSCIVILSLLFSDYS